MVHYEEKIFALTFEASVEVDFLVLNFKVSDLPIMRPRPHALTLYSLKRTWRLSELAVMN
jgi:hypothetical protein